MLENHSRIRSGGFLFHNFYNFKFHARTKILIALAHKFGILLITFLPYVGQEGVDTIPEKVQSNKVLP